MLRFVESSMRWLIMPCFYQKLSNRVAATASMWLVEKTDRILWADRCKPFIASSIGISIRFKDSVFFTWRRWHRSKDNQLQKLAFHWHTCEGGFQISQAVNVALWPGAIQSHTKLMKQAGMCRRKLRLMRGDDGNIGRCEFTSSCEVVRRLNDENVLPLLKQGRKLSSFLPSD